MNNDNSISAVLVLSHLMNSKNELSDESKARADLAAKVFVENNSNFLVTSGWDYRRDSNKKIGNVVKEYLIKKTAIKQSKIIADTCARDTVGDAFFIKKNVVERYNIERMIVVTSKYHVNRTKIIFKKFFYPNTKINVIGAKISIDDFNKIADAESRSIDAFYKTFEGINFSDNCNVMEALRSRHPFYNGEVHKKYES